MDRPNKYLSSEHVTSIRTMIITSCRLFEKKCNNQNFCLIYHEKKK